MGKEKPVFNHQFDVGEAMALPWNLPGGRNFLFRILIWGAGLLLAVYAIFGRNFLSAYGDLIIMSTELNKLDPEAQAEKMGEFMSAMSGFMGPTILLSLVLWIVFIMIETAMHKNVFRGTDHGAFPLRFGKDETRVLLAQLVIFVCAMLVYMVGFGVVIMLGVLAAAFSSSSGILALIFGLATLIGFVVYFVVLFRVMMGWAPAAAMSVRDEKQYFFEGWTIAKGRNGPLFGTYVVVSIIGYFAVYIVMILGGFIAFGNMEFMSLMMSTSEDPAALIAKLGDAVSQPRVMVPLVIFTILYVLTLMLWYIHFWAIGLYMARLDAKEKGML